MIVPENKFCYEHGVQMSRYSNGPYYEWCHFISPNIWCHGQTGIVDITGKPVDYLSPWTPLNG